MPLKTLKAVSSVTLIPSLRILLLKWLTKPSSALVRARLLLKSTKLSSVLQRVVLVNVKARWSIRVSMASSTRTLSKATLLRPLGEVIFFVLPVSLVETLLLARASTASAHHLFSRLL